MPNDDFDKAVALMESFRGQYILGQALHIAIESLESVEPEHLREMSNINDMKLLRDGLFPIASLVAEAENLAGSL